MYSLFKFTKYSHVLLLQIKPTWIISTDVQNFGSGEFVSYCSLEKTVDFRSLKDEYHLTLGVLYLICQVQVSSCFYQSLHS